MSIIQGTAKSGGSTGEFYDYPIEDSLRFDGSSYLSRTPSTAGNQKTWTFSFWAKRGNTGNNGIMLTAGYTGNPITEMSLSEDGLGFVTYTGSFYNYTLLTMKTRDTSAWYHFVVVSDTTQATQANRGAVYMNGVRIDTGNNFAQNLDHYINLNVQHNISNKLNYPNQQYFDGYLANIQLIDGQALDASYFGETKQDIWVPKAYTGSYGTNGFHLTFEDGIESLPVGGYTGNQNAFRDKSHNTNHWKIN